MNISLNIKYFYCLRYLGPGCDQTEMLGEGLPFGKFIRMDTRGSHYRFSCNPGYQMIGHPAVYCDGSKWNGTKPSCQAAASVPELTMDNNDTKAGDHVR